MGKWCQADPYHHLAQKNMDGHICFTTFRFNNLPLFNKSVEPIERNGRTETGAWDEDSKCWSIYSPHKARIYSTHPKYTGTSIWSMWECLLKSGSSSQLSMKWQLCVVTPCRLESAKSVRLQDWECEQDHSSPLCWLWVAVASTQWCRAGHKTIVTKEDSSSQWSGQ